MHATENNTFLTDTHTIAVPTNGKVLLRAKGLKKNYGGQVVLDGIDLELHQGEVVLLLGENGSGKTTLLNLLTGNQEPDSGEITYLADDSPRSYRFPRRWWQELNPFDHFTPEFVAHEGVSRTWQDVRLFGAQTLRDNIAIATPRHLGENPLNALFAPKKVAINEERICAEADALLKHLGLEGREDSSADMISLGQSKRVAIARTVAAGAKILFLDEPLSGLDRQGITEVLALLEKLAKEYAVTLVIVEHVFNLGYLHDFATTDWLLANGRITRSDRNGFNKNDLVTNKGKRSEWPVWFSKFVGPDIELIEEQLQDGAQLTRVRHPSCNGDKCKPILSVENLEVARGKRTMHWEAESGDRGLSFTVNCGETVFLQAPNGWGKTTLLDCVAGILPPRAGIVRLDGKDISASKTWQRARAGIRVVKSLQNVFVSITGNEMLRLAGSVPVNFEHAELLNRTVSKYSGGQRQQLALASSQTQEHPRVYIYDEPFSMLDASAIEHYRTQFKPDPRYGILVLIPSTQTHKETAS
jgi:branched-chain amino acid transport system ATP-binding protein